MSSWQKRLRQMQGLIETDQGERLATLASTVPSWSAIVEVGSHTGLSTCYLGHGAANAHGAHVFAVDPWGDPRPGSRDDPFGFVTGDAAYQRFSDNITAEGLWSRVTPLRMTSLEAAAIWRAPVGLVFIDAVHTEEAVQADFEAWSPFLTQGGWLVLHDYENQPGDDYYGVSVVADRLAATGDWDVAPRVGTLWSAKRR